MCILVICKLFNFQRTPLSILSSNFRKQFTRCPNVRTWTLQPLDLLKFWCNKEMFLCMSTKWTWFSHESGWSCIILVITGWLAFNIKDGMENSSLLECTSWKYTVNQWDCQEVWISHLLPPKSNHISKLVGAQTYQTNMHMICSDWSPCRNSLFLISNDKEIRAIGVLGDTMLLLLHSCRQVKRQWGSSASY